ncbi:MAG: DUF86 domain-containing protein [Caldilineae bacterium]|nr:MAG: DUF86 domain-containing protein [Caldilineae bacterium]
MTTRRTVQSAPPAGREIERLKETATPILKRHHVLRAGLFGSTVRGEATSDSDIDILVDLPPHKSLLDLVGLKLELEEALGRPVDLVEYSTLHPLLEGRILAEEVSLIKRDDRFFLQDILESITRIEAYTHDLSENDFLQNNQAQDAVVRRLEIIGEATKNLPRNFRQMYPDVPWQRMAGMRDVLIHGYFGVDFKRVWEVVEQDLPGLKQQIAAILDRLDAQ